MAGRQLGVFLNCSAVRLFRVFVLRSVLVIRNAVCVFVLFGLSSLFVSRKAVRLFTMFMLSSVLAAMFAGGRRWVLMIARAEGFGPDLLD